MKYDLKAQYYIRYVDDFVLLHTSKKQLEYWKSAINIFLRRKLRLELHQQKSKIISLHRGVDFVGFRNFYYFKLLRKRNITNMKRKIILFNEGKINYEKFIESFQGWSAYAEWANACNKIDKMINKLKKIIKKIK